MHSVFQMWAEWDAVKFVLSKVSGCFECILLSAVLTVEADSKTLFLDVTYFAIPLDNGLGVIVT